ncbi:MAG: protein phosphatase 2C domain-containing protein [Planctomycetaceae bacterium]|jgi:serine/threonine protein phosphatase PrpC|nr:protein phosphatase 2C domain-containing protein [Planctomycetaceae bacterium]
MEPNNTEHDQTKTRGSSIPEYSIVFLYQTPLGDERPHSYFIGRIEALLNATNIPTGSVGVPYEIILDLSVIGQDLIITNMKLSSGFTDRGFEIQFAPNKIIIKATPRESIDSAMYFIFQKRNKTNENYNSNELSYNSYKKPLLINPHPRDLWQNLPVTDYEGYKNDDFSAAGVTVEYISEKRGIFSTSPAKKFEVIAASQRGRSHAHVGKPRDDCFHFEFDLQTGWNFVAVADGAGSAKFSRKGSDLACHNVIASLRTNLSAEFNNALQTAINAALQQTQQQTQQQNNFDQSVLLVTEILDTSKLGDIFHNAVYTAYKSIYDESQKRKTEKNDAEIKDYHTTLLCAAFKYFDVFRSWVIVSYWVGDGGAAILRRNGGDEVIVLGEPDGGEFAGQTKFLTMKDEITAEAIRKRLRFTFCETFGAMLFVTDGITDPFFPSEAAVADGKRWIDFYENKLKSGCEEEPTGCPILFNETIEPQKKAEALLKWLDFWSKGNHDDRTILIVKESE